MKKEMVFGGDASYQRAVDYAANSDLAVVPAREMTTDEWEGFGSSDYVHVAGHVVEWAALQRDVESRLITLADPCDDKTVLLPCGSFSLVRSFLLLGSVVAFCERGTQDSVRQFFNSADAVVRTWHCIYNRFEDCDGDWLKFVIRNVTTVVADMRDLEEAQFCAILKRSMELLPDAKFILAIPRWLLTSQENAPIQLRSMLCMFGEFSGGLKSPTIWTGASFEYKESEEERPVSTGHFGE